ncbi:MAG: hypothetical protein HPY71_03625 [Firmicutes bacterium]|nr:hypothetical protein [Bacillota bacterium]
MNGDELMNWLALWAPGLYNNLIKQGKTSRSGILYKTGRSGVIHNYL